MMKQILLTILSAALLSALPAAAQEIRMTGTASVGQVMEESQSSETLLSMNEMGMDMGGYMLYETEVTSNGEVTLEVENVRDYASVYVDGKPVGGLDNAHKSLTFNTTPGQHILRLYVENIGRITYGPEILDNSKGLFGVAELNGEELQNWTVTPLLIHDCDVTQLQFATTGGSGEPCFHQGVFNVSETTGRHLDVSGWGMGEVWLNGEYLGSYWDENSQQSLPIPDGLLTKGENRLVVFELKQAGPDSMRLSDKAVFK